MAEKVGALEASLIDADSVSAEEAVPDRVHGAKVGSGVAWSALNTSVLRLGQLLMSIVIARIVSPREFGVFVVALTVYTIVINISDVGVGSALVREVDRSKEIGPTVSSIAIGTNVVLASILLVTAPYLASALGSSSATNAVRVLAITLIFGGIGSVPAAVLMRDYRQRARFAADASFFVSSNAILIVLALSGMGVMALAWSRVIAQLISTIVLVVLSPERYWPRFNPEEARRLLRFGIPLAGANLLGFTVSNVDFIVVSRLKGSLQLGYYNLAYNISGWPVSLFTAALNNVTLATLSRARESKMELERHLNASLAALSAAAFPVSALTVALARPLIGTVYGERWMSAAAALATLSIFGSVRVIVALLSDLLVALGRTRRLLLLQGIWLGVLIPSMVLGVHLWGILGAGIAHSVVALVVVIPSYAVAIQRGTDLRLASLAHTIVPPLLASVAAGIVGSLVVHQISTNWLACVLGGLAGGACYVLVLSRWLRTTLTMLRRLYRPAAAS